MQGGESIRRARDDTPTGERFYLREIRLAKRVRANMSKVRMFGTSSADGDHHQVVLGGGRDNRSFRCGRIVHHIPEPE
jgi:hypothetical protein